MKWYSACGCRSVRLGDGELICGGGVDGRVAVTPLWWPDLGGG